MPRNPLRSRLFPAVIAAMVAIFGVTFGGSVQTSGATQLAQYPPTSSCTLHDIYGNCVADPRGPNPAGPPTPAPPQCLGWDGNGGCLQYAVPGVPAIPVGTQIPVQPQSGCAAYDIYGRCVTGVAVTNPVITNPVTPLYQPPTCAAYDAYGNCLYYAPGYYTAPPTCASFDQYGNCVVYQPASNGSFINPYGVPVYCIAFDQYGNCVATQYSSAVDQSSFWSTAP
jgi:hypothetical protein